LEKFWKNNIICKELLLGITIVEEPLFRITCHNLIFKIFKKYKNKRIKNIFENEDKTTQIESLRMKLLNLGVNLVIN
jgi:hypothetical protein